MAATFHIRSFGCRANQAESEALAAQLARAGMERGDAARADWIVLHTCTVTAEADREARRAIRRLHRMRPEARIAVTGCYAERSPAELAGLEGVTVVAGHAAQWSLGEQLVSIERRGAPLGCAERPACGFARPQKLAALALLEAHSGERSRPIVQVQQGCGRACSFCVIPQVRGASRSRPLGEVLAEMAACAARGHAEVVCSGINLGQWGADLGPGLHLADMVRATLEQTALPRLRLSSVEPADWSHELTELMASSGTRLARHAHLPLQSGSDAVLRRMHRRYRASDYAATVEDLAARVPGVAIGADVMAGFPGESEREFGETMTLLERLPLAYLHVFPFSPRPGTEAAERLATDAWRAVPAAETRARVGALRKLGEAKRAAFLDTLVGTSLSAVTLSGGEALSDNYARVRIAPGTAPGALISVQARTRQGEVLLTA